MDNKLEEWKKEAGEIPENTCPTIDKCIDEIKTYINDVEYLRKNARNYDDVEDFAKELPDFGWSSPIDVLDTKIRKDNEQLRNLGIYWYERTKDVLKELENLKEWVKIHGFTN